MSHISKRLSTLMWAFFECMFFSSIVVGWTWLAMIFREDGYFLEPSCNTTEVNVTSVSQYETMPQLPENTKKQKRPLKFPCRSRRDVVDFGRIHSSSTDDLTYITRLQDKRIIPFSTSQRIFTHPNIITKTLTTAPSATIESGLQTEYNPENTSSRFNPGYGDNIDNSIKHSNHKIHSHIQSDTMSIRKITQPAIYNSKNIKNPNNDIGEVVDKDSIDYPTGMSAAYSSDNMGAEQEPPLEYFTVIKVDGYCFDQNEKIRTMFAVVLLVRDLLAFPVCIVYDKYGTTRTRLLTVLVFAVGTLMMTFTNKSFPWLVIPALTITGLAGSAVFLTNLQTANLFGRKRHVVISLYVGAAYSNGIITLLMKLAHFRNFALQTSFMILAFAIVPILVSTVAFLPKTRIPWPLPADYGKRRNQSLDEAMLRRQRAWQRRMSEAGLMRNRKPAPQFTPLAIQSLFVWSVMWFSCQRLQEAVFETHLVDIAPEPLNDDLDVDMETYYSSIQLLALVLAPLAGLLIDRDPRPALGLTQATQQMQRIVPAIVTTSMFGMLEVATDMMYGPGAKAVTIIFNILHKVFTYTTMCAFVMHLHFNHQNLGKLYGLTVSLSAVLSAFQFPIRTFLIKKYDSMFPAHILLLVLNLVALAHAINVWDHCRKRLIKDQSDNSSERFSRLKQSGHTPTVIHIETDDRNLPGNHGDRLGVSDQMENSITEVSGVVSSFNAPSDEKATSVEVMDLPTKGGSIDSNGGARIVFTAPFRDDEDDDDDEEVYGEDDFTEVKRGYNGLQTIDFV